MSSFRKRPGDRGRGRGRGRGKGRKGGWKGFRKRLANPLDATSERDNVESTRKQRLRDKLEVRKSADAQDTSFGFERHSTGKPREGWLLNLVPTVMAHAESGAEQNACDCYMLDAFGDTFKATIVFYPYFYLRCAPHLVHSMENFLKQKYDAFIDHIDIIDKVDLDLKNHLSGLKRRYLKLVFKNDFDLKQTLRELRSALKKADEKREHTSMSVAGSSHMAAATHSTTGSFKSGGPKASADLLNEITDLREFDVAYITRLCIDLNVRVGKWFTATPQSGGVCKLTAVLDKDLPPDVRILAFDIETTKPPLKFPNAEFDQIMMISYMLDTDGYLIVNRSIVSDDIDDFEYTPKPEYEGNFTIFNESDEMAVLQRWFDHIRDSRPHVYVTYNGDFFDWPFIEARAERLGFSLEDEIGISVLNTRSGEYGGRFAVHLDCFCWVQRDSYLPQGSQSLKAVTKKKLRYNPVELDPELMTPYASEKPHELATYSVSDAVATYYLFKKYVESFIFSLCKIIPMHSADVLRKGSGTLCEALLMIMAKEGNIIAPNKQMDRELKFHKGHVLESETYIGGHVEAFEAGVFRADVPVQFVIEPEAYQQLIDELDDTLQFAIEVESKLKVADIANYAEIKAAIKNKLENLRDNPRFEMTPLIYHLDVSAMYPNIILTNRLQPVAVVSEEICAACDYNRPGADCQRRLDWRWRGKYYPATRGEYKQIRNQIEYDRIDEDKLPVPTFGGRQTRYSKNSKSSWKPKRFGYGRDESAPLTFADLSTEQQITLLKARLKDYSQRVYRCQTVSEEIDRNSIICQRENGFYVDTVQMFRDRRYKYKRLVKSWANKRSEATDELERTDCDKMVTLYDSMQLAHKCILNSFYGYVMRRGARWYSMDMAAITTHIGGKVIRDACDLCQRLGRPLELDTDGIWTLLPSAFPENFKLKLADGSVKGKVEYPCSMLNLHTHQIYTNTQHQSLVSEPFSDRIEYEQKPVCTIFFEVDGPYKAMVLPASTEEGRKLKKRYCVFDFDGKVSELKGFEIKRRGELKMIKIFQEEVFSAFLRGGTLQEIYGEVGQIGKRWLDILDTRGMDLSDAELFDLITESKNMSRSVADYGGAKSTSLTCAKRLAEFLGDSFLRDSGLACKFIISRKPIGSSVSERAVPVDIFLAERPIMRSCVKRWLSDSTLTDFDIRSILDWDYYRKRVGQNIQKIVTIPAAMQGVSNPIPNLLHPPWLERILKEKLDPYKQKKITSFFTLSAAKSKTSLSSKKDVFKDARDAIGTVFGKSKDELEAATMDVSMASARDMEDIGSATVKDIGQMMLSSLKISSKSKKKSSKQSAHGNLDDDDPNEPVLVTANVDEDFLEWHRQTKRLWRRQRKERKQRRRKRKRGQSPGGGSRKRARFASDLTGDLMEDAVDEDMGASTGVSVARYVQKRLDQLYRCTWQIVQIVAWDSPGKFTLWCLCGEDKALRKITLCVKRKFYVNVIKPSGVPYLMKHGTQVSRTLPRNRPRFTLVQLEMDESEFVRDSKKIGMFITSAYIEGVYETNVPLWFRVISTLGCCAAVRRSTKLSASHSTDGFDLSELEFVPVAKQPYLEDCGLKFMFLYMSKARNGRAVIGLFAPNWKRNTASDEAVPNAWNIAVACVNPFKAPIENARLKRFVETESKKLSFLGAIDESTGEALAIRVTVDESRHSSLGDAFTRISQVLSDYRQSVHGRSTVAIVQSTYEVKELCQRMPVLKEEFATITLPFVDEDNVVSYPPLQWYPKASKTMCQHFLFAPKLLGVYLDFARYSHIPIGNLNSSGGVLEDSWIHMCDVFMSRLCDDAKHVLWISEGSRPDLGGLEEDDNLCDDELANPILNNSGAYFTYCVEISVKYLTINTIAQSEHIHGLDLDTVTGGPASHSYGDSKEDDAAADVGLDGEALDNDEIVIEKAAFRVDDLNSCMSVFRLAKKLVRKWIQVVAHKQDGAELADRCLIEFYRWLRSSKSKMYDPLLHRMVHSYMTKVFSSLVFHLCKKLGANVVFASFDSVVIDTKKTSIANAVGYVNSIMKTISDVPMFQLLKLDLARIFKCLIWLDRANYGGVKVVLNETGARNAEDPFDAVNFDFPLESQWNVASFLPPRAEDRFLDVVDMFLEMVRRNIDSEVHSGARELAEARSHWIQHSLSKELFRCVTELSKMRHTTFPLRPGSYMQMRSPALEFVKCISQVLALDTDCNSVVCGLKADLFRILHLTAFDTLAEFKDPCATYVLCDVSCLHCKASRDVDLCRDMYVKPEVYAVAADAEDDDDNDDSNAALKCHECGKAYDSDLIESMLLEVVRRRETSYHSQDLVCSACKQPKLADLKEHCASCSAPYRTKTSAQHFKSDLKTFLNVSRFYGFDFLTDTVTFILQGSYAEEP